MKKSAFLVLIFIASRLIFYYAGVRFDYSPLEGYWQYLDVEVLRNNLASGIWYQTAQPPLFNLFLGGLLKLTPTYPSVIFPMAIMMITMINVLLIFELVKIVTGNNKSAWIFSLVYMLAPATVLLENELFYTGFLSMLLLFAALMLTKFWMSSRFLFAFLFFLALAMVCLTKTFYHFGWMLTIVLLMVIRMFPAINSRKLLLAASLPILLVAGWYGKNYYLFGNFSATSWSGMNLARLVYHNKKILDSSSIASIPPFFPVSSYKKFLGPAGRDYGELNARVLKKEFKQGTDINMFNSNYQEISTYYFAVAKQEIRSHPTDYLKNVLKATLIFFSPASSYFKIEENERKIKYYDALGSLNFSSFFGVISYQKKSLAISSFVMMGLFAAAIIFVFRNAKYSGQISPLNTFILFTIFYSLMVSSFFEYGENMRFRYEIQPLFLVLFAQFVQSIVYGKKLS